MQKALSFRVREDDGRVTVLYTVNEDPRRLGYGLLNLPYDVDVARGFPVVDARVEYPAEGYAGFFGWIQTVRYRVHGEEEDTVVAPDVAPQLDTCPMPYLSFGYRPSLFDAPSFTARDADWEARSFLTQSPDMLMTRHVEPVCGFVWGYELRGGVPSPMRLRPAVRDDWRHARDDLIQRLPDWRFGGDDWDPPAFDL